jgi:hypothetical protein
VTRASNSLPVAGATVTFANNFASIVSALTDSSGNYTASGLPDGSYIVYASIPTADPINNLAPTGMNGSACEGDYDPNTCAGPKVTVSSTTPLIGINVSMATGATVTGLISDNVSGAPNPYSGQGFSRLELLDSSGQQAMTVDQTSAAGYATYNVAPGTYTPVFTTSTYEGWIDIGSDGTPCPRRTCNVASLPKITLNVGTPVTLNVSMPRGARLYGKVTDAATALPILQPGFDPSFNDTIVPISNPPYGGGFGVVDGNGIYATKQGFAVGTYYSATVFESAGLSGPSFSSFGAGYIDQAYSGVTCPYMTCNLASATSIPIGASDVRADYVLSKGGAIAGTVTNLSAAPLDGVIINAFNGSGQLVAQAQTNALGAYSLPALPSGSYFAATTNSIGYSDQVYTGIQCTPICNPVSGTPINVTAPSVTAAIDFVLQDRIFSNGFE